MTLRTTSTFERSLKKLVKKNAPLQEQIEQTLVQLLKNPQHPSLRLHKITSQGVFSVSVNLHLRVLIFFHNDEIVLLEIGTHDQVY